MKRNYLKSVPFLTLAIITGSNFATYGEVIPEVYADPFQNVSVEVNASSVGSKAGARSAAYSSGSDFKVIIGDYNTNPELLDPNSDANKPKPPKIQLYQKTNFPEMRRGLEKLFDSYVTDNGGFGPLYTSQVSLNGYTPGEVADSVGGTYAQFMGTKMSQQYFAKPNMTTDLAELAKLTFKDIKGNEWYAHLIPPAVYFGVINGYEDGTFKGNNPVSRAELGVMFQNYTGAETDSTSYKNIYGTTWYSGGLDSLNGSVLHPYLLDKTTITQGATRGEVATVFASHFCPGTYTKYMTALDNGTIKDFKFTDIKGYSSSLAEDFDNFLIKDVKGYYPAYKAKMKTPTKPPKEVLAALLALHEENVMRGDGQGNANWTAVVTRGEVLSLINKGEMRSSQITK